MTKKPKRKSSAIRGWVLAGTTPEAYTLELEERDGLRCAYVRSKERIRPDWTTVMQSFKADDYRGQRLRLRARVGTERLSAEAKLWVRLDEGDKMLVIFYSTALTGDTELTRCEVVLDVDAAATSIAFGLIVGGTGAACMSDVAMERVGTEVPTTPRHLANHVLPRPTNLGFGE